VLNRAAVRLAQLRITLRSWYNFYALYDPKFSWWVDAEFKKADEAIDALAQSLHTPPVFQERLTPVTSPAGEAVVARGSRWRGWRRRRPRQRVPRTGALGSNEELSGAGPAGNDVLMTRCARR